MNENPYKSTIIFDSVVEPSELQTAGIRWRLLARMADSVFALGVLYCVMLLSSTGVLAPSEELGSLAFVPSILFLGVNLFLLVTRGQSFGKWLVQIQIADFYSNKLLGPFRLILIRENLLLPLLLLSFYYSWASILWTIAFWADLLCGLSQDRRCIHDYLAGSHVISYDPSRTSKYGGDQISGSAPRIVRTQPETSWEIRQLNKRVQCIQDLAGDGEAAQFAAVKLGTVGMTAREYYDKTVQSITNFMENNPDDTNRKVAQKLLDDLQESFNSFE